MQVLVEPACYVWAAEGTGASVYPPSAFIDDVLWLESFFSWNRNCRIPMTSELQTAVSRLFPYEAAASTERMGQAQELVGMISRMIDRLRSNPNFEYGDASSCPLADLNREARVYQDEDVWLSWQDLLTQCIQANVGFDQRLDALASTLNSCVTRQGVESPDGSFIQWHRRLGGSLPTGTVDPVAMLKMESRWRENLRSVVWEVSGHQPSLELKRVVSRVVADCKGIVLRFGSTYFNPAMPSRCSVLGRGTGPEQVAQLALTVSDGLATLRGVLLTTAETPAEQAAATTFVRNSLKERCDSAGYLCEK